MQRGQIITDTAKMLMGKLCQFFTELSAHNISIFSFQDNNWSKPQWSFTKLDKYIDNEDVVWDCQWAIFFLFFTELTACNMIMVGYYRFIVLFSSEKY